MTRGEAINWLINISADIGKREHKDLWHYEQALFEIREMLEAQPEKDQIRWERDTAIQQLADLGYGLGEKPRTDGDCISRQAAIDALVEPKVLDVYDHYWDGRNSQYKYDVDAIADLPSAQPERKNVVEIPETGIGDLSDGYHTFNGLYEQRMILFAALVKAYKDRAWKSYRHEDGEWCFGGGWFIVGIDTPEGSYTYHYENKYWDMFDCADLPRSKHWDGHTEDDAETRLMSLEPERKKGKWLKSYADHEAFGVRPFYRYCSECNESTVWAYNYCPNCGADMRGEQE